VGERRDAEHEQHVREVRADDVAHAEVVDAGDGGQHGDEQLRRARARTDDDDADDERRYTQPVADARRTVDELIGPDREHDETHDEHGEREREGSVQHADTIGHAGGHR